MENQELTGLKRDFESWRRSESRGRFIPESLWERAGALASKIGATRVQKELRLDFNALKKRMNSPKVPAKKATTFVRLPFPAKAAASDCVIKIESVSGARMQAELSGVEAGYLSQVLRDFGAS